MATVAAVVPVLVVLVLVVASVAIGRALASAVVGLVVHSTRVPGPVVGGDLALAALGAVTLVQAEAQVGLASAATQARRPAALFPVRQVPQQKATGSAKHSS